MRIPLIAALLAATALIPAAANAQSRHDHGDRGHSNGRSESRPSREAPRATAQSRPSYSARQARPQANAARGYRAQPQSRRDAAVGQGRPSAVARTRYDANRRVERSAVQQTRYSGRQDDRHQQYGNRGQSYRGRDNSYRNDNRSQSFNRGWRNDQRYDYRGYRSHNRSAYRLPRYYAPRGYGYGYHRYSVGYRLSALLFGSSYWIGNPYDYRLPPAYGPYRWVRYYNDALLVDIRSGAVVDTVYDIFW